MSPDTGKLRIWVRVGDAASEHAFASLLRDEGHEVLEGPLSPAGEPPPDLLVLGIPAPEDAPQPEGFALPAVLLCGPSAQSDLQRWLASPGRRLWLTHTPHARELLAAVQSAARPLVPGDGGQVVNVLPKATR